MRGSAAVVIAMLCGAVALAMPGIAKADVGFQGPGYPAGTGAGPTGTKSESKLWWNDGFWWASMFSPSSSSYNIFRLNMRLQTWVNTGVQIDTRDTTRQDALWTGSKLFIASHKFEDNPPIDTTPDQAMDGMRLYRFSYNATTNTYTLDGPPTDIDAQRSETLTVDRDSNGAIWATWVQQESPAGRRQLYVRKTGDNCTTGALGNCSFGSVLVLDDEVGADDISAIVRFGANKVGVMWSDTSDTGVPPIAVLRFAFHTDGDPVGMWTFEDVISGSKAVDDHINLKADSVGRVYAVTKTNFTSAANPGSRLHRRLAAGGWATFTVSQANLDRTRPIVLVDQQHNRIRVFEGTAHPRAIDPTIYMKASLLSSISFAPSSLGTPVIQDPGTNLVNPSSTKQNITNTTRQIVVASNTSTRRYWHAYQQINPCIRGTVGNNVIWGTNGNDVLCGLGGRDTIRSLAGHDSLNGGPGNDTLIGVGGRDRYIGGSGNDTIYARDTFREVVSGGLGFDRARVNRTDIRQSIERLF
ncbi:MAG: calcium-binding protein [Gaiellaceae bacterium]